MAPMLASARERSMTLGARRRDGEDEKMGRMAIAKDRRRSHAKVPRG